MNIQTNSAFTPKKFTFVADGQDLLLPLDSETCTFLGLVDGTTVNAEIVDGELVVCGANGKRIYFSKNDH